MVLITASKTFWLPWFCRQATHCYMLGTLPWLGSLTFGHVPATTTPPLNNLWLPLVESYQTPPGHLASTLCLPNKSALLYAYLWVCTVSSVISFLIMLLKLQLSLSCHWALLIIWQMTLAPLSSLKIVQNTPATCLIYLLTTRHCGHVSM